MKIYPVRSSWSFPELRLHGTKERESRHLNTKGEDEVRKRIRVRMRALGPKAATPRVTTHRTSFRKEMKGVQVFCCHDFDIHSH